MVNKTLLRRYVAAAAIFVTGFIGVFLYSQESDSTESNFEKLKKVAKQAYINTPLDGLYVRLNLTEGNYTEWNNHYATVVESHLTEQTFDVMTERSLRSIRRVLLKGLPRYSLVFDAKALAQKLLRHWSFMRVMTKYVLPGLGACLGVGLLIGLFRLVSG